MNINIHNEIINKLTYFIEKKTIPHIIFMVLVVVEKDTY